jgi:hypothetical protein
LLQFGGVVAGDSSLSILVAFAASALLAAGAATALPAVRKQAPRPLTAVSGGGGGNAFDSKFWAIIAVVFLGRFGMGAYYSFFSLYLRDTFPGSSAASMMWAVGALAEIAPSDSPAA